MPDMTEQSATFTAVDLSKLPAPAVVETLSYETIYAAMLARLRQILPDFDAVVESDPAIKVLQVAAYRELLLRQRINEAARAVMPAYAIGPDLDNLAALLGISRLQLHPGNPGQGIPPTMEDDADLRRRMVLAPEGYSVAGPEGAYIFHALSADGEVLDASATSPTPGTVVVTVLSRIGDGTASAPLLERVAAKVSDEAVRPLTDQVIVQSATILSYAVKAEITTFSGPDGGVVMAESRRRLAEYITASHRLGRDVTLSGLYAALHAEGVQNVKLLSPSADIIVSRTEASWCTSIDVTHMGVGE